MPFPAFWKIEKSCDCSIEAQKLQEKYILYNRCGQTFQFVCLEPKKRFQTAGNIMLAFFNQTTCSFARIGPYQIVNTKYAPYILYLKQKCLLRLTSVQRSSLRWMITNVKFKNFQYLVGNCGQKFLSRQSAWSRFCEFQINSNKNISILIFFRCFFSSAVITLF